MKNIYPLFPMFLLVFSFSVHLSSETFSSPERCLTELGVLNHGSIYVPCDYILAVDGSIKHGEISFVLEPSKRSSDRYSNITITKLSEEHLDKGYIIEAGEVCGITYYEPLMVDQKNLAAPTLSFLFFEVGNVFVSIGSKQRGHALQLMRVLLMDSCKSR